MGNIYHSHHALPDVPTMDDYIHGVLSTIHHMKEEDIVLSVYHDQKNDEHPVSCKFEFKGHEGTLVELLRNKSGYIVSILHANGIGEDCGVLQEFIPSNSTFIQHMNRLGDHDWKNGNPPGSQCMGSGTERQRNVMWYTFAENPARFLG